MKDKLIAAINNIRQYSASPDYANIEVVKYNLAFFYQVILATNGMLEEAIKHSKGDLKDYFTHHLAEEQQHAEWLAEDLLELGVDVKKEPTKRLASAMAGTQYYLIKHVKPECLLGYMAVIEGFPASLAFVEYLESTHGKKPFRTLRIHAEEDINHANELFEIIEQFQCAEVLENAIETQIYLNELSHVLRAI